MKVKVGKFQIHSFRESCLVEKIILLVVAMTICSIISICCSKVNSHAAESAELNKTYSSYMIEEGDTLTDVARMFYSPAYYGSFQDAVKEVKELNNLKNDHITEGCYLIIPVFVD